jgi:hypothetical protein
VIRRCADAAATRSGLAAAQSAIKLATTSFRGLPLSELNEADLIGARENARDGTDSLAAHSVPCALGEVDCFLSHSWPNPALPQPVRAVEAASKYATITRWAADFKLKNPAQEPMIWLGASTHSTAPTAHEDHTCGRSAVRDACS